MKRKILNLRNFKKIQKFINKFSLNSFSNKKKVLNYMKFFELQYLLKKISEDKLKSKHEIHLRNVKDDRGQVTSKQLSRYPRNKILKHVNYEE